MKFIYKILGTIIVILLLNFIINLIFVNKNNGKDYIDNYIRISKDVKIKVNPELFDEQFTHTSFFKYTILFKGIYGKSADYIIKDDYSQRYFKITRFNPYGDKFRHPQTYKIDGQELYVKVDPLQINNPSFGTKENPILVFSYKGVNNDFIMDMDIDEKDENGVYKQTPVSIAPTQEEYRYNVEQYLTYVMPKEEFKKRFK